uniref:Uncharacterized protein n=1 Tax=Glossina brevipalpis TaxID=37001 RepID=A0A1A9W7W5_9MUSC
MASSSNGSIRMNILSGSAARRQRAGDENSTETANESEQIIESSTVLKFMASISLICTYPIQLDAAYHYIVDEFNINQKKLAQYGVRFVLVVCIYYITIKKLVFI